MAVDAVVTSGPDYSVLAVTTGTIQYGNFLKEGKTVRAGQTVAHQGKRNLIAAKEGHFVRWLVPNGSKVQVGMPVALLAYSGFAAIGSVRGADLYRLYTSPTTARVQITNGPGPQDCALLPAPPREQGFGREPGASTEQSSYPVVCALDSKTQAFEGLPATLGITTVIRKDVLVLPISAVAGSAQRGTVQTLVLGTAVDHDVKLGATDGVKIEIVEGLVLGEEVLLYATGLKPNVAGAE